MIIDKFIFNILYKLIPYRYIKKLYDYHELLNQRNKDKITLVIKNKATKEMRKFLNSKPIDFIENILETNNKEYFIGVKIDSDDVDVGRKNLTFFKDMK